MGAAEQASAGPYRGNSSACRRAGPGPAPRPSWSCEPLPGCPTNVRRNSGCPASSETPLTGSEMRVGATQAPGLRGPSLALAGFGAQGPRLV